MRRIPFIIGGALGLCVAASPCVADTLDIKFEGMVSGYSGTTDIWYDGSPGQTVGCGLMRYSIRNVTEGSPFEYLEGTMDSFCVDIWQNVDYDWHNGVLIQELENLPVNGGTPMGTNRAELISALWWTHFDEWDSGTPQERKEKAAAFQIAIWEFGFEGHDSAGPPPGFLNVIDYDADTYTDAGFNPQSTRNSSSGEHGFYVSGGIAGGNVWTYTHTWMTDAWNLFQSEEWCRNQLWGVDVSGYQGVAIPIPLPAPFALAGVGLLGVLAGRRKLARLVK